MLMELLKNREKDILIYGASVYGELAYQALKQLDLKPLFFVDRAFKKMDTYFDIPVIAPEKVSNYRDAIILIASADFYYEILNFLEGMDCENIYDITELLALDLNESKLSHRALEMYSSKENYISAVSATELTIVHLGVCVTEMCSLKCRDCSFLMPYYHNPKHIDLNYYKKSLDRLIDTVDYISELRIYGGEPFLNPEMYKLIDWYDQCSKVGIISIYTNGTVLPKDDIVNAMKSKKVKVHISNYKHNVDKISKLTQKLEDNKIDYFIRNYSEWQEAGNLDKRSYSDAECVDIYRECFATNCYSFLKGKFYVCPRAAHAVNLGAIEDKEDDRIDFMDENISIDELKEKLSALMHSKKFIDACHYCDGLNNHIQGVEPAIQTREILEYKKISGEK